MAWRYVRQPNGKLAVFSEVVDQFVAYDMSDDQALGYYITQILPEAREKINRADNQPSRFDEAIETIHAVHGHEAADKARKTLSEPS